MNSNENDRAIIFPGVDETAHADFKSHTYTGYAGTGYTFKPTEKVSLEPGLSVRASHLKQNAYTETNAPGLNLFVHEQKLDSVVSSLGLRLGRLFFNGTRVPLNLGVRSAWEYEMGDTENPLTAEFADAPGNTFTVHGTPRKRNSGVAGLDLKALMGEHWQAFADYLVRLNSAHTTQRGMAGLAFLW